MSRSRALRFPTLILAVLLLLAPVAASAEPAAPLDVSRVVQLLLSFLTGDNGPGLDPSGASAGEGGSGLDPSGRS